MICLRHLTAPERAAERREFKAPQVERTGRCGWNNARERFALRDQPGAMQTALTKAIGKPEGAR